jgi:hypothetical protein
MLNISLVFQNYLYSFYAQQSNKFLPCFAFTSIKTLKKMAKNRVNHINEKKLNSEKQKSLS